MKQMSDLSVCLDLIRNYTSLGKLMRWRHGATYLRSTKLVTHGYEIKAHLASLAAYVKIVLIPFFIFFHQCRDNVVQYYQTGSNNLPLRLVGRLRWIAILINGVSLKRFWTHSHSNPPKFFFCQTTTKIDI